MKKKYLTVGELRKFLNRWTDDARVSISDSNHIYTKITLGITDIGPCLNVGPEIDLDAGDNQ